MEEYSREKVKDVRFGVNRLAQGFEQDIASSGAGWISMSPVVLWAAVQPNRDAYRWGQVDEAVRKIQTAGLEPTITLMPVSSWATPEAFNELVQGKLKFCDYPDDEEGRLAWAQFVEALVERYDGDGVGDMPGLDGAVLNWHVVEEWPTFWYDRAGQSPTDTGNAERYVALLKATYTAIKREIPEANVIVTGLASTPTRLLAYAEGYIDDPDAGVYRSMQYSRDDILRNPRFKRFKAEVEYILREGCKYFDAVDIHLQDEKLSFTEGKIKWLKDTMARLGCSKPVLAVESGGPFKRLSGDTTSRCGDPYFGGFTEKENAIIAYAAGLERFQWSWTPGNGSTWDGPFLLMPLRDSEGNPKPAYYTYVMLQYFMNGFTGIEELNTGGGVRLFKISLPKGEVYVAWSDEGAATLDLSRYISGKVVVHRIVTETDRNHNPVTKLGIEASSSSIEVTETPIFIVKVGAH